MMHFTPALKKSVLVLIITTLSSVCSLAQEKEKAGSYTDDELYSMDLEKLVTVDVVSTSKINLKNESKAAGAVTVVSREDIVNSGAKNIEEVLRLVSGFDVSRTSFTPNTTVGVRGLYSTEGSNNKVLFLVDGHPFRSIFNGDATVFLGNISLNNISRIEIIRGPGSTLFGTGAFLGVINIVTKDAEKNIDLSLATGSFGTYELAALGTLQNKEKKFKATVSANHFKTDGPDVTIKSDVAKEQLDPYGPPVGFTGSASGAPGKINYARKTTQLNLNSELGKFYLKSLFGNSEDMPPVGPYDALTEGNNYKNKAAFGELGFRLPFENNRGEFLIKTYYDYAKMDYQQGLWASEGTQLFNYFTPASYYQFGPLLTGPPTYYAIGEEQTYRTVAQHHAIGSEANLAYNFNDRVKLISGLMFEDNKQFGVKTYANGNIFFDYAPEYIMSIGNRNYAPLEAFGSQLDISKYNWNRNTSRQIYAVFSQAEIDLVNSLALKNISHFALTLGGRYDHYSDAGERFNPRAALIFSPHDRLYFKAMYGTAFRAPSFSELYTTNNSLTLGDSKLKPETVDTREFVVGHKTGKFEASVTYFDIHVKNNIQLSYASVGTSFAKQYANLGQIRSQGLEASLRYSQGSQFSGFFNFTLQHVEDISHDIIKTTLASNGESASYTQKSFHPGGIPAYIINAGGNYAITKNVGLNISGNYLGKRIRTDQMAFEIIPGSTASTGNIVDIDSRKDIDARLILNSSLRLHHFDFAPNLELQITGYNLTDSKNYNEAGNIFGADLLREGVNWMAKLRYQF